MQDDYIEPLNVLCESDVRRIRIQLKMLREDITFLGERLDVSEENYCQTVE